MLTTSFWDRLYAVALPAVTLTLGILAHMMRLTRTSIVNLLASRYLETARLKGLGEWAVLVRHALPNAWGPLSNVIVLNLAYLITGVVVVEVVFVLPGLGQLIVNSVQKRGYPGSTSLLPALAGTYVLLNLTADILSIVTNPRLMHPS